MATCSEVASCLSEGASVCIITSGTCPPCVYALSGGDFSCYSRDTSGECPFSGAYAECDKASSSTTSTSRKTNSDESSGDTTSDTPAPITKTKAPAKITATPTATTATPTTSTTETSSSTSDSTTSNETPSTGDSTTSNETPSTGDSTTSNETPSTDATLTPSTTAPTSSTNENQATQTASSASNASPDSGAEKALTSNTASTSGSPAVVNLTLIGGAVVLVVIVIAFVTRRVVRKKKMSYTQEGTVSSQNSAWSDRTLGTGGASGGNLYSTYSYKDEAGKGNGISMLSDSQASSTDGPSGSSPRSTADFSNYGGDSKYATESQYYNDYSVSTGPALLAAGAMAGNQHPYANSTVPPSARGNNNFVDATSMANRESSFGSVRQHPLTVSQLMDSSVEEDESQAYADRRRPAPEQYQEPKPYNIPAAVPQTTRNPQIFATSTASSMRSDYDIVDPITMQEVEARNTEMLAEDGRYPKFSFESEAASDVYEGSSSEEESDDEHLRHGEHTI